MRICGLALLIALAGQPAFASARVKKVVTAEHPVRGTVVSVDVRASSITIREPNLMGYLHVQARTYQVRQRGTLVTVNPGDKVTALFLRKDGKLHRLRHLP